MRIVSGQFGGRVLNAPKGQDVRPTSDKVRGAVFNALGSRGALDEDTRVLDLFCGTGALGLEALSRGAAHCTFVDKARSSLECARGNADSLGLSEEVAFLQQDASTLKACAQSFDLVFLDPPYGQGLAGRALEVLQSQGWLGADAWLVVEVEKGYMPLLPEGYALDDERRYGDTTILFLRYHA